MRTKTVFVGCDFLVIQVCTSKRVNLINQLFGPVWQRNYREHILRNDEELNRIRRYIADKPANWETDPNLDLFIPRMLLPAFLKHFRVPEQFLKKWFEAG